jgi:hypothetical protein
MKLYINSLSLVIEAEVVLESLEACVMLRLSYTRAKTLQHSTMRLSYNDNLSDIYVPLYATVENKCLCVCCCAVL